MDEQTIKLYDELEFDRVLEQASFFCKSLAGKAFLRNFQVSYDSKEINERIEQTLEAVDALEGIVRYEEVRFALLPENTSFLARFKGGGCPEEEDLIALSSFLDCDEDAFKLKEKLPPKRYPALGSILNQLTELKELRKRFRDVFTPEGKIKDGASRSLYELRKRLSTLQIESEEKVYKLIGSRLGDKREDIHLSIRNNRLTVNIPTGLLPVFRGLIIDYSGTGLSVYVEPEELVELNNERQKLLQEEEIEVRRIVADFTAFMQDYLDAIEQNFILLVQLDVIFGRASYSNHIGGTLPILSNSGNIILKRARHPLMLETFTPEDLVFKQEKGIVISGVNAGGKTVLLKLIGVMVLMSYCGFFLPADEKSEIAYFDQIFADIGKEQSVASNLSTFTSRIEFLKQVFSFLEGGNRNALVLIDEIGAGTDPTEGAAFGCAVMEYLVELGAKVAVTTHQDVIKAFAEIREDWKNVSLEFDEKSLKPTFRVIDGIPGKSFAFDIAEAYGIPKHIIEAGRKKAKLEESEFSKAIEELRRKASILEELKEEEKLKLHQAENVRELCEAELEKLKRAQKELKVKFEKLTEEFERTTRAFLQTCEEKMKSRLEEELKKGRQVTLSKISRQMLEEAETSVARLAQETFAGEDFPERLPALRPGATVHLPTLGLRGKVVTINEKEDEITILSSGKKVKVKLSKVKSVVELEQDLPTHTKAKQQFRKADKYELGRKIDEGIKQAKQTTAHRLDLHGLTREEALEKLEKFISDAILRNLDRIYILHGIGGGTLKTFVHEYLSKSEYVQSFREATLEEGGKGITVVTLI